jgi:hypothetical protein
VKRDSLATSKTIKKIWLESKQQTCTPIVAIGELEELGI